MVFDREMAIQQNENLGGKAAYRQSKNYNYVVCTVLTVKLSPELMRCVCSPPSSFIKGMFIFIPTYARVYTTEEMQTQNLRGS